MMTFLICSAAWWIIGVVGFVYWWTSEYDFTADLIPPLIVGGIVGPFAWVIGYSVHGENSNPLVIFKKRKK